jgi:uncharacterized membrane protein YkoI
MSNTIRGIALLAAITALSASPAAAQQAKKHVAAQHETQAQLQSEATVSMDAAKATALAKVPNGTVKSGELEREKGRLIYSFDITVPGKSGIDEVAVDAKTGTVVGPVVHETPKMERAEAKAEAKEAKDAAKQAAKKP